MSGKQCRRTLSDEGEMMVETKYGKSIKKLEEIIEKIEGEEIDVDELSERVKEAVSLIKVCKDKIEKAELEVKKVVDGFDGEG
jgi:exodeoxyribonuclease VII small subunit